jgi:hypothetical protein
VPPQGRLAHAGLALEDERTRLADANEASDGL